MEGTDKLDMSLDDLIEQHKRREGGGGPRGRRRGGVSGGGIRKLVAAGRVGGRRGGRGGARGGRSVGAGQTFSEPLLDSRGKWKKDASTTPRRYPNQAPGRFPTRPRQPYRPVTITQRQQQQQQHVAPPNSLPSRPPPVSEKLFLSNLEYRVSERDLLELFSQIGPLRSVRINYDKSGRSLGTGEVTFEVAIHATMAERRFNGILIDSKPLVIQKGGPQGGHTSGPTKLSSGITLTSLRLAERGLSVLEVVDPSEGTVPGSSSMPASGRKPEEVKTFQDLKTAVVATIAPEHPSLNTTGAGPRIRSSVMRSGMYSDRMDIS